MSEIMELENKSNQVLVFEVDSNEYICSPGVNPVELIRSRIRNVEGAESLSASTGTLQSGHGYISPENADEKLNEFHKLMEKMESNNITIKAGKIISGKMLFYPVEPMFTRSYIRTKNKFKLKILKFSKNHKINVKNKKEVGLIVRVFDSLSELKKHTNKEYREAFGIFRKTRKKRG